MNSQFTRLLLITVIIFYSVINSAIAERQDSVSKLKINKAIEKHRSWQKIEALKTGHENGEAFGPDIALDSDGNAIAVWLQYDKPIFDGGNKIGIWAKRYTPKKGWEKAQKINTAQQSDLVEEPSISMDSRGNAVVVWKELENYTLWSNTYIADTGWGSAQQIENSTNAFGHNLAMNSSGSAVITWNQSNSDGIWINRYKPKTGWGKSKKIYDDKTLYGSSRVAINDKGEILAVWKANNVKGDVVPFDIWIRSFNPQTGWEKAEKYNSEKTHVLSINLAIDSSGKGTVVWSDRDGQIWSSHYMPKNGWETKKKINIIIPNSNIESSIDIDSSDHVFMVWSQKNDNCTPLWFKHYAKGNGWNDSRAIDTKEFSGCGLVKKLQVVANSSSGAIALWHQNNSLWASQLSKDKKWSPNIQKLSGTLYLKKYYSSSNIAITPNGNAIVIFGMPRNKKQLIYTTQFK